MSQFMKANVHKGYTTPNIEKSEGVRPAQHYVVAKYVALTGGIDQKSGAYKAIRYGKVLAVDTAGDIVPAGYAIDVATAIADGNFDNCYNKYSALDIEAGVKNFAGETPEVGEAVVKSFFTDGDATKVQLNFIGKAIGMAAYDLWQQNGAGRAGNPLDYQYTNFNMQQGLNVLTRYFIELPVVANTTGVALPGMTVFEGTVKNGDLVTFNVRSNFCAYTPVEDVTLSLTDVALSLTDIALDTTNTYADAAVNTAVNTLVGEVETKVNTAVNGLVAELETKVAAAVNSVVKSVNDKQGNILGKVYFVDTDWPKDYLEWVRTYAPSQIKGISKLETPPGDATNGLPDNLWYAGVTDPTNAKTVRINVII